MLHSWSQPLASNQGCAGGPRTISVVSIGSFTPLVTDKPSHFPSATYLTPQCHMQVNYHGFIQGHISNLGQLLSHAETSRPHPTASGYLESRLQEALSFLLH